MTEPFEVNELLFVSNEVAGENFVGDFGWPGLLFCNLVMLGSLLLAGDLAPLSACTFRYLSCGDCTLSGGAPVPADTAAAVWSNLLAIFRTRPGCRDEGDNTGVERTLLRAWLPAVCAGFEATRRGARTGDLEKDLAVGAFPDTARCWDGETAAPPDSADVVR